MVEVKVKKNVRGIDSGIFDTFFSLNDLAQIAGVLTATERLSELADDMYSRFGEVELCREVIRGVRSAITAIYTMGGVLYSVPIAQRMLDKYDVELSTWTRFKMGARFYTRRMVVMWILASILSAAATVLLVARFVAAAYGVAMGTVPVAALGYLAAAIGGVCLPLTACVYMLKQIGFVYDRFVESVKVARAIAYDERTGVNAIDEQEDCLPSAYFVHSVSDYDLRKSRQLVRSSSVCLAVAIVSLCLAFLLDALFPLKSGVAAAAGTVAPSLTLWYDFVVVGLSFMVGALLVVCGSSQFLHDSVALTQLRKAILEAVDAKVLLRDNAHVAEQENEVEQENEADGIGLQNMSPGSLNPFEEETDEEPCCNIASVEDDDVHEEVVSEAAANDCIFVASEEAGEVISGTGSESEGKVSAADMQSCDAEEGSVPVVSDAAEQQNMHEVVTETSEKTPQREEDLIKDKSGEREAIAALDDVILASACQDAEQEVARRSFL
ncbi:hypothetical protein [Anaplasma bovis]|uniref:hypothetical protein n=1 Tax=Anaplasma bovis TaxID=186733 RepID=UPI002FF40981